MLNLLTKYGPDGYFARNPTVSDHEPREREKASRNCVIRAGRSTIIWCLSAILMVPAFSANAADNPRLATLLYSRGFEFMVALDQGSQAEAKKLGVQMSVQDGQSDSQVQTNQVDDLLAQHISAIVIAVANSKEMVPAVRRCNQANVPVVAVDSIIGEGAKFVTYVGFDNAAGAKMAADYIVQHHAKKVLELEGALGAYHAQKRHQGFEEGMKAAPDAKVISRPAEWLASNAQSMTADALTADPDIDAIFSHNDEMIRGVVSALKQINRFKPVGASGHIMIVGIDGTPLAMTRIRNGEQDATVHQDPFKMGALAVDSSLAALQGKQVPPQQLLPPTLITKENVDDQQFWGNRFKP